MADLTSAGRVQSEDQIRENRQRKGLCGTCRNDPVQCYSIKKRLGGVYKERIPLTEEGKVYNGICLECNPHLDPRTRAHQPALTDPLTSNVAFERDAHDSRDRFQDHRRQSYPLGGHAQQGNALPHTASAPNIVLRKPTRQANFRQPKSSPLDVGDEDTLRQNRLPRFADEPRMQQQEQQHKEQEYAHENERGNWRNPKPHTVAGHKDQDANMGNVSASSGRPGLSTINESLTSSPISRPSSSSYPTYSPQYSPSQPSGREMNSSDEFHRNIPYAQDSEHNRSAYDHRQREELDDRKLPSSPIFFNRGNFSNSYLQDDLQPDSNHPRHSDRNPSAYDHRQGENMEDRKLPSVPDFPRRGDFSNFNLEDNVRRGSHRPRDSDRNHSGHERRGGDEIEDRRLPANRTDTSSSLVEGDEFPDSFHRLLAEFIAQNPDALTLKFVPSSSGKVLPNSIIELENIEDDPSVLTQDTFLRDMGSVATMGTRKMAASRRTLGAIDESSSSSSSGKHCAMISHQISEPDIPRAVAAAAPAQDMGSYLNNATPNLKNLSEFIEMCNTTGLDEEAINALKIALIHDNGMTRSIDLAIFCLTKLLVLARKSDDNKRMMIVDDIDGAGAISALDAIVEAARTYPGSAEIQQEVCAVLWSLSIKYQKHIAQNGGCKAILDSMKLHMKDDTLQGKALGALKVISFDSVGKSMLLSQGGMAIVADAIRTHAYNPAIQSVGCVILGNLAVDEASQSALTVSENEVEVIINGMIAHPSSLEVQEAA